MIPGDLLSAYPHRQFHTLPGLLDSRAAPPNSYPKACMPMQGGSLYHFYGLWYDPAERRTHDLPCERRTRYQLSQPDTVFYLYGNGRYGDSYWKSDTYFFEFLVLWFYSRLPRTCNMVTYPISPSTRCHGQNCSHQSRLRCETEGSIMDLIK